MFGLTVSASAKFSGFIGIVTRDGLSFQNSRCLSDERAAATPACRR